MIGTAEHAWLPRTTCDDGCVGAPVQGRIGDTVRIARRIIAAGAVLLALPILAVPVPGRAATQRLYCRLLLSCLGIRITLRGDPIRNLRGLLVVSNHVSWVDVFAVGAVVPGSFVARADVTDWPGIGRAARMVDVIPIERRSLRLLPSVVHAVAHRLREGRTVVAFPEGTTYCGEHRGRFRPAVFQAAVETGRPVQPLRVSYWHGDGRPSTRPAFLGEESLWDSLRRIAGTPRTVVQVDVRSLELPGADRRELAMRCETALLAG